MANFNKAYYLVARAEGGFQINKKDKGNYNSLKKLVGTNWGISAPIYERYLGYPPTERDMRAMTKDRAKLIYYKVFWQSIRGNEIKSQPLANIIFDGNVNHGYGIHLLQEILKLKKDGVVGPITLKAINQSNPATLYNAYKARRIKYYHHIVKVTPSQKTFLKGWLIRINRFNDFPNKNNSGGSGGAIAAFVAAAIGLFFIN